MQYPAAFTLILIWMVDKLQCSDRTNSTTRHIAKLVVTPTPTEIPGTKPIIIGRETEPLNLTCVVGYQKTERNDIPMSNEALAPVYNVDWKEPHSNDNRNYILHGPKIERGQSGNSAWLWFERPTESDSGNYTCNAFSQNASRQSSISIDIQLSVKSKIGSCGTKRFKCHNSHCILLRYVCDGLTDCTGGEDEAECGPEPCHGKVFCGERCLPLGWCCELGNCNHSSSAPRPDTPGVISTDRQHFNEMGFLQTTIYTVIGCAMAFMFIVTILVIMICRVHMKRAMNSRCPQQIRNPGPRPRHSIPLYDLDVYLNRAADINSQGGVTVTYNINNGVQFVGRPVEPPPYSEIAPVPPREGPPPPYVSQENLLGSPVALSPGSTPALAANGNSLTTQFINNEGTAARIAYTYQNNQNPSSAQCFTARQIPGPQATPGFSSFNMNSSLDNASNTTLNTSDSTALNTSSNSDSSSNNSISNFVICRNITSHSQNFEPEYTETDSLLIESQNANAVRNSEITTSLLPRTQRSNGVQESGGITKNADVPLLLTENVEGKNLRGTSNVFQNVGKIQDPGLIKISGTEPSLLGIEYEISNSMEPKCSQAANSSDGSVSNREVDSTLQRLSSKTVLDLSMVGESSKTNLSRINNETASSLPFYLNLTNPVRNYAGICDAGVDKNKSSLVVNRDSVNPDSLDDVLRINEIIDPGRDTVDSSVFENGNKCLNVKDDQMLRVPLVTVGNNSVAYNNLSTNMTAGDVSGDDSAKIVNNSVDGIQVRETQPVVMPLRESFIGLRKEK